MTHALAKDLHAAGFRVFEIVRDKKIPAIPNWQRRAEKGDLSYWKDDSAVGIATGGPYPNGKWLFVLDVDYKPDHPTKPCNGYDDLARLEAEHGPLPSGPRVKTPSGGVHIYMWQDRDSPNSVKKIAPGLDVKCVGGLVVAPGQMGYHVVSEHPIESLFWF